MPEDLGPSAGKIRVKITSPLSPVADLEADSVEIPTPGGRRLMMPKTAPLFCLVRSGKVIVHQETKAPIVYRVSSGICEMRRGICAIMAWGAETDKLDRKKTEILLAEARQALPNFGSGEAGREIQDRISFYQLILKE